MAQLLDQYGNPIKKESLLREEAAPSITGVRQPHTGHRTYGLDPSRLARLIRAADEGDITGYLEMAAELEEKDAHYASVIGTRKRAVSQLDISVVPASDDKNDLANAQLLEDWIRRDHLQGELFDILDAIGKGFSVTEILWDTSEGQWMPRQLKWREPSWFKFDRNDGETLYLDELGEEKPLSPYKFLVHTHKSKSGIPIRGGVVRPCSWMWLFKNFGIKDWVVFTEAYGQPVRVGKYGAGASDEDKRVLLRAVASIGSDAAAIIPESMQIEFVEAEGKASTADIFEKLCKFADQQMSKAVLGQTTTTDAISGGHAVSKEHNEVREDIRESDARQLMATLNSDFVPMIVSLNRGPQKRYPRILIGRPDEEDTAALAETATKAHAMGIPLSVKKTRDRLGLDAPEDEDDALPPAASASFSPVPETASQKQPALAVETAAAQPARDPDIIDALADEMAADWEEVLTPVTDQLEEILKSATDFDDFIQKLLAAASNLETGHVREKIARAVFNARLAGNHEINLDGNDGNA